MYSCEVAPASDEGKCEVGRSDASCGETLLSSISIEIIWPSGSVVKAVVLQAERTGSYSTGDGLLPVR